MSKKRASNGHPNFPPEIMISGGKLEPPEIRFWCGEAKTGGERDVEESRAVKIALALWSRSHFSENCCRNVTCKGVILVWGSCCCHFCTRYFTTAPVDCCKRRVQNASHQKLNPILLFYTTSMQQSKPSRHSVQELASAGRKRN